MVSYARAKSEGLGFTAGTGMAAVGVMPREVRLVILRSGPHPCRRPRRRSSSTAARSCPATSPRAAAVLAIALGIIAIGATITVIQRILHVRSQAKRTPTTPQAGEPASNGETNQ